MRTLAVILVVGVVCVVGASPADAAEGEKQFLKDCTLHMNDFEVRGGGPAFAASESGTECDEYFLRGISMVTTSGEYVYRANDDAVISPLDNLLVIGAPPAGFAYGTVDVFIPYRSRCDRYRLYASGAVRFLDSRSCDGVPTARSGSYGGYLAAIDGPQTVRAGFEVTTTTCTAGQVSGAIQGVRMGGTSHLAVLGFFCASDGTLRYLAEVRIAGSSTIVQRPAAVGEHIRMSVRIDATSATATVRNVTRGWIETKSGSRGFTDGTAAIGTFPFIGPTPLAQFAPVVFTNVTVADEALSQSVHRRVVMVDSNGVVRVQPSSISGSGFTNTWKHA